MILPLLCAFIPGISLAISGDKGVRDLELRVAKEKNAFCQGIIDPGQALKDAREFERAGKVALAYGVLSEAALSSARNFAYPHPLLANELKTWRRNYAGEWITESGVFRKAVLEPVGSAALSRYIVIKEDLTHLSGADYPRIERSRVLRKVDLSLVSPHSISKRSERALVLSGEERGKIYFATDFIPAPFPLVDHGRRAYPNSTYWIPSKDWLLALAPTGSLGIWDRNGVEQTAWLPEELRSRAFREVLMSKDGIFLVVKEGYPAVPHLDGTQVSDVYEVWNLNEKRRVYQTPSEWGAHFWERPRFGSRWTQVARQIWGTGALSIVTGIENPFGSSEASAELLLNNQGDPMDRLHSGLSYRVEPIFSQLHDQVLMLPVVGSMPRGGAYLFDPQNQLRTLRSSTFSGQQWAPMGTQGTWSAFSRFVVFNNPDHRAIEIVDTQTGESVATRPEGFVGKQEIFHSPDETYFVQICVGVGRLRIWDYDGRMLAELPHRFRENIEVPRVVFGENGNRFFVTARDLVTSQRNPERRVDVDSYQFIPN